jgi:hypothetical protein
MAVGANLPSLNSVFAFYVDPGSGSMVIQLVLGGASGVYVVFRLFKQKIMKMLGLQPKDAPSSAPSEPTPISSETQETTRVRRSA